MSKEFKVICFMTFHLIKLYRLPIVTEHRKNISLLHRIVIIDKKYQEEGKYSKMDVLDSVSKRT